MYRGDDDKDRLVSSFGSKVKRRGGVVELTLQQCLARILMDSVAHS